MVHGSQDGVVPNIMAEGCGKERAGGTTGNSDERFREGTLGLFYFLSY